jgi:hypothetical protein
MSTEAVLDSAAAPSGRFGTFRALGGFFKRNLTPRTGAAVTIWRVEARLATPLALLFIATLGRWEGALAMGAVMAVYAAVFLFLLDGERVVDEMRDWTGQRRWGRRWVVHDQHGGSAGKHRLLLIPAMVMVLGPFWRAVSFHVGSVPRWPAYGLSVGGSFPHSLLWTGLVMGGIYELAIRPLFEAVF